MMRYELIEHTADIGIKAYGKNLEEAFENSAFGMFKLITDTEIKNVGEVIIKLESEEIDDLLVKFLSELLFLYQTELYIFSEFDVKLKKNDKYYLEAKARGETLKNHECINDIKAVTYHMLEVNEKEGYVKVIFDV
ncbi:MAG: archease [Candidatus Thermoplasmatota archaeon]